MPTISAKQRTEWDALEAKQQAKRDALDAKYEKQADETSQPDQAGQ